LTTDIRDNGDTKSQDTGKVELLPCRCGGNPERKTGTVNTGSRKYSTACIECQKCGMNTGYVAINSPTPSPVIWNIIMARTPNAEAVTEGMAEAALIKKSVKDVIQEDGGFWNSCSGCHETVGGYSSVPVSTIFKCQLGIGCHECGGIGAVWDNTDYEAIYKDITSEPSSPPPARIDEPDPDSARGAWLRFQKWVASSSGRSYGAITGGNYIQDCAFINDALERPVVDEPDIGKLCASEPEGRKSDHPCEKCGAMEVYVTEINDHPDYRITCHACKKSYCVDGPDA